MLRFLPEDTARITANYLGGARRADGYALPGLAVSRAVPGRGHAEYDDLRTSGEASPPQLAAAGVDVRQVLARACCTASSTYSAAIDPSRRGWI